jgi:molybdopterin synthase catalytic subunit
VLELKVRVRFFTSLREISGKIEEEFELEDHAVLASLINKIVLLYGQEARKYLYFKKEIIDPSIYFLVNGVNSKLLGGENTMLNEGDIVAVIPPIGGGKTDFSIEVSRLGFFSFKHYFDSFSRIIHYILR